MNTVGETLRDNGMAAPATGGGTPFLQAKTANEVLKAQERKLRLAKLKGEHDRAKALLDDSELLRLAPPPSAVGLDHLEQ